MFRNRNTPKEWLYGLTAEEWFQLAAMGQESEVAPCCGDISSLREALNWLATSQGEGEDWLPATEVLERYFQVREEHGLMDTWAFPLLHRVLAGIQKAHPEMWERIEAKMQAW